MPYHCGRFGLTSVALAAAALLFSLEPARAAELPFGTKLEVRLTAAIGSRVSHAGDPVRAVVVAPVLEDERVVIPQGAVLSGHIASAQRLGLGLKNCTATVEVQFTSLQVPEQAAIPFRSQVLEVEAAKERVNSMGVIGGIHPVANLSSGVSIFISALLMQPGIAMPVLGVKFLLARSPDPEIYFPAGTELIVRLQDAADVPFAPAKSGLPLLSASDEAKARRVLEDSPDQQSERGPNEPSDLSNLLFLGTQSQIDRAFRAAGWTGAQGHNALAVYRMFHCVVQRAGYSMAPMTRLRLNGVTQQASYQKSLDTFAKRHHIRLWKQGESDAWISAASEDVAFAVNKMLVTHASDRNIDNERAKVVNDLTMTGCISAATLLSRDNLRIEDGDAHSIVTDGKIAALRLNDCKNPPNAGMVESQAGASYAAHISLALARDVARSNPVSLGYSTARMILNHSSGQSERMVEVKDGRRKKMVATEALLSNHWKRPSMIESRVAFAGGYAAEGR